jgi:hypothetical protein
MSPKFAINGRDKHALDDLEFLVVTELVLQASQQLFGGTAVLPNRHTTHR